jgi:aspartyl-tRNA(Asn)/glutamyl-tRNA(Gln) amidotransferase subunit B
VGLGAEPKAAANWMIGDLTALLREAKLSLSEAPVKPRHIADIVRLVENQKISTAGAKQVLVEAFVSGEAVEAIVEAKGLAQISDESALMAVVEEVVAENPGPAEQFRAGKEGAIGFLVGAVMKKTKGAANPQEAQRLLRSHLSRP